MAFDAHGRNCGTRASYTRPARDRRLAPMSPTESQLAIDAFLEAPAGRALSGVTPQDARTILERFLECVANELQAPLETADPHALHFIVGHVLPTRYPIGDPLAISTGVVLEAYLEHSRPKIPAQRFPVMLQALRGTLPEFVEAVRTGEAVHHGLEGHGGHGDTFVRDMPKVGRNEPCPCGSAKKFKACHGRG